MHSYLILAYADGDKVAMNVGFYYMANAGGRLVGTVLSGLLYQWQGLEACLWASAIFVLAAGVLSRLLPSDERVAAPAPSAASEASATRPVSCSLNALILRSPQARGKVCVWT